MAASYPTADPKRVHGGASRSDSSASNASLLDGLMHGRSDAARAFCHRYGPRINRWVWRLLGADDDHDEVVQQVYVGLLSSLSKLKDVNALDAFVDSVTIRTVRKEIRRRKLRRLFVSRTAETDADSLSVARPLREMHVRAFYRMLDRLSTDDRTVFVLKHFEGLTMEEIAQRSGYSLRTANRRLYRATARLKEMMMKETVLIQLLEAR